jgi:hypothetical protein
MSKKSTMSKDNLAETNLSDTAQVDSASVAPLPGSHKIYVEGSRPDIRVPMREITLTDTPLANGVEKNASIRVYDTSGPYTDPTAKIDVRKGLADVRSAWILERNDTELLRRLQLHVHTMSVSTTAILRICVFVTCACLAVPKPAKMFRRCTTPDKASSHRKWNTLRFVKI